MAVQQEGNFRTFKTAADLSAKQWYLVKQDSAGDIVLGAAQTDKVIGVLQNKPEDNDNGNVRLLSSNGTGKVIAGGTVAIGDKLTCDSAGKAIATTTATHRVFGIALEAGAANEIVEYLPVTEVVA